MKSLRDKIWESAIRSLKSRSTSRFDLRRKLLQKYPGSDTEVDLVLNEMERVELINDKRYTEQYVHHLIQRPVGRMKIQNEARKKGLDLDLVERTLLNLGYDEEQMVRDAAAQKIKTLHEPDKRKRRQKMMNFLRNRGFRDALIYSCLSSL